MEQVHEVLAPLDLHEILLGMIDDRDSFGSRIVPWDNALLLMAIVAGSLIWAFRNSGWFD